MRIYFIIPALLLLMSGCSSTSPSITEYRISTNIEPKKVESAGCKAKSLKVAEAFSASALMSLKMNYATGSNKQFTYSQSQYSLSVSHSISSELLKMLREMDIFKTVQISKSRSRNDLILETSIDDFMQYFSEDEKSSFVNVVISLSLLDTITSTAIASKTFSAKLDTKTLDAEGGVDALNIALSDVLLQTSDWLVEVCK